MDTFVNSPVIPLAEAALSAVFLFVMFYRRNMSYLYPILMLTLPAVVDVASASIGGVVEYPAYYFSLAGLAVLMMVKMFEFKHDFTAKAFFVLTFVCVILAVITTHIQLSDDGSDATMLGLVFILCWWAMDCLLIWMAFHGKFTRNRAKLS